MTENEDYTNTFLTDTINKTGVNQIPYYKYSIDYQERIIKKRFLEEFIIFDIFKQDENIFFISASSGKIFKIKLTKSQSDLIRNAETYGLILDINIDKIKNLNLKFETDYEVYAEDDVNVYNYISKGDIIIFGTCNQVYIEGEE